MGKSSEYSPSVGLGLQMPGTPWMLVSSSSSGPLVWGRHESCCESAGIPGIAVLGGDLTARQGKRGRGCWPWAPSSGQKQENLLKSRVSVKSLSRARLFASQWTAAHQASLSMRFSRQGYWRGLPFPSPGDLPNPGIEPVSPKLQADSLPTELQGKIETITCYVVLTYP